MIRSNVLPVAIVTAMVAFAAPALAITKTDLEPAFKNTVSTTYPSGRVAKLWLNRDGSYDAARTNGDKTHGSWTLKGEKLCMTQQKPFYVPISFCTLVPKGGVGTSWNSTSFKGEPVRNTLVAGR